MSNASIQTDPNQLTKVPAQINIWDGKQWLEISNQQTINTINKNVGTAQKTADGKNSITWDTDQPDTAITGDIWLKKDANGNYSIQVYNGTDWDSPAEANIEAVKAQVAALPQNYYSATQPSGTNFTDGSHWYEQTGTDSNGNPVYTVHLWNSSTKNWDKMLNSGEVDNANQISQVKSDLTQAQSDITKVSSNLDSVNTNLKNQVTQAQSDITTAQNNIKTNADAISDANGNISSLQSSASKLESDMADAQGNISTLQTSATTFESDISSLQSDNTTNKQNISSLQNTANGFSSTVATLQTQVNNSAVGTNLLLGTSGKLQTVTNATGWGGSGFCATNRTDLTNETYTARAYISPASHGAAIFITVRGISDGSSTNLNGNTIPAGSSGYSELTYTVPAGYYISQAFISFTSRYSDRTQVSWKEMKLELGSHATDYSANPADNATVTSVSTLSNTIDGLSNTVSNNSGNITTLQTRADGFDVSVGQLQNNSFDTTKSYAGLSINSNGLTQVAGSTSVYLSNTHGFEIQKSGSDIFHVDTSGNLTMQGNITAGNISGVNFTGNSLTLAGTLAVTGSISADNGNVVINSSGLTIKGAGLTIGDSSGNTTTYIQSDGTFITNKGVFTGSVTSSNVTITGGDINMNGGKFHVDSSGNVTANSIDITGGNVLAGVISGTLDADNIILKGAESTLNMSGDDLMFQENSGEKWITDINSKGISFTGYAPSTSRQEFLGGIFINYEFEDEDINGLYLTVTTGANMHSMISNANGDEIGINVPYVKSDNAGGYSEVNDFKVIYNASGAVRQTGLHIYDDSYYSAMDPLLSGNASESGHINCSGTGNFVIESLLQNLVFNSPKGKNIVFQGDGSGGGVVFSSLVNFVKSAIVGSGKSGDQIWVRGAGNFDGTVSCKSLTQTSLLSKKTNISKIDPATALDKINQTNIYDYQFKSDVEQGSAKHYASYIIDDVNDVSQYTEPSEFLSEDRKGRDDGSLLAYAALAIQELDSKVINLEAELTTLKSK